MLPKWHVLLGFLFAYLIYWFTSITIFQASLIFFSSVLIDFDHYLWIANKKGYLDLKKSYNWHKNLPKNHKPIMHSFHSIEFLILIGVLGFYFNFFLFIFIGLFFHSILDTGDLVYRNELQVREFSFIRYLILKQNSPKKYL